jgi:hypothetical protein
MKRAFTSVLAFIFLGFLVAAGITVVQNLAQNIQKVLNPKATSSESHLLAYE